MSDFGATRPMTVQEVDDEGNLWFMSANDSRVDQEIASDPSVKLFFQGSEHSDFMDVNGHASTSADRAKVEKLWSPMMKTWFTGGKDDPRISVIKVTPSSGYYWDNKHGNVVAGLKMMIGAAIGVTLDDSIQGRLAP
jgi:general stress protein 26